MRPRRVVVRRRGVDPAHLRCRRPILNHETGDGGYGYEATEDAACKSTRVRPAPGRRGHGRVGSGTEEEALEVGLTINEADVPWKDLSSVSGETVGQTGIVKEASLTTYRQHSAPGWHSRGPHTEGRRYRSSRVLGRRNRGANSNVKGSPL